MPLLHPDAPVLEGPRSATNPRAATIACAGRVVISPSTSMSTDSTVPLPWMADTWALVEDVDRRIPHTACTVRSWARNASRRCTRVTERATGSRCSAQSKAESPPPTMTTSLPAYGAAGDEELQAAPEPVASPPAGRGLNLADAGGDEHGLARISLPSRQTVPRRRPGPGWWRSARGSTPGGRSRPARPAPPPGRGPGAQEARDVEGSSSRGFSP